MQTTTTRFTGTATNGLLYLTAETSKRIDTACYVTSEVPAHHGRAFTMRCAGGQSDKTADSYEVTLSGSASQCTCKGFAYGRGKACKHVNVIKNLIETGRI